MSGAIPALPKHTFMTSCSVKAQGTAFVRVKPRGGAPNKDNFWAGSSGQSHVTRMVMDTYRTIVEKLTGVNKILGD